MSKLYDVLIIGGGPAGLSTALGLARQHKSCVVFSDARFRNAGAVAMHAVASRDGEDPAEFRNITREQIAKYGNTTFIDTTVVNVCKEKIGGYDGFRVIDKNSQDWLGRKLVFATGCQDIAPNIKGYAENWPLNMWVFSTPEEWTLFADSNQLDTSVCSAMVMSVAIYQKASLPSQARCT
jgi:gliotoxin/aspirochlorine biosynthesis thioredoxin reductase